MISINDFQKIVDGFSCRVSNHSLKEQDVAVMETISGLVTFLFGAVTIIVGVYVANARRQRGQI